MSDIISLSNYLYKKLMNSDDKNVNSSEKILEVSENKVTNKNTNGGLSIETIEDNLTGGATVSDNKVITNAAGADVYNNKVITNAATKKNNTTEETDTKKVTTIEPVKIEIDENVYEGGADVYDNEVITNATDEDNEIVVIDKKDIYKSFIEHMNDTELYTTSENNINGGNSSGNLKTERLEILNMFPYLIRI